MALFIFDLESTLISKEEEEILQYPNLAGVLLFTRNFSSRSQLKILVNTIKLLNPRLFILVDQEGGNVQRLQRHGFRSLPSAHSMGLLYNKSAEIGLDQARYWGSVMAQDLLEVGIHSGLGPVLDRYLAGNPIIADLDRSFHADPYVITELAKAYIEGMRPMPAVGKHFPGHGSSSADSHVAHSFCYHSLAELKQYDIYPFQELIRLSYLDAIMMSHVIYPCLDKENPAGYSFPWIHYLREELHFHGFCMSDCLSMAGADIGDLEARVKGASQVCDALIIANQERSVVLSLLNKFPEVTPHAEERRTHFLEKCLNAEKNLNPTQIEKKAVITEELSLNPYHHAINKTKEV